VPKLKVLLSCILARVWKLRKGSGRECARHISLKESVERGSWGKGGEKKVRNRVLRVHKSQQIFGKGVNLLNITETYFTATGGCWSSHFICTEVQAWQLP